MDRCALTLALASVLALPRLAAAADEQRGDAHAGLQVYAQPAPSDYLIIVTPTVSGHVIAKKWLTFDVSWLADVVTGATPRTYGPPDVVTAATRFNDFRNVLSGGAAFEVGPVTLSAGYAYGTENDYHSHQLRVGVRADLFQHNTVLAGNYSHGFDRVCDLAQGGVPVLLRQPLDTSRGCFSANPQLTDEGLDIDTAEVSVVQSLTPKWIGTLVASYQHLSGFQSNPYRRVRLSGGFFQAQESHPHERDRFAVTARVRYAVEPVRGSAGVDLRLYRDTWGIQSITGEASYEQPFRQAKPEWRFGVRARGYAQSGAVFYRDAGNPDSYDRAGPVGSFFTADQALAPLADLIVGARATWTSSRRDKRYWRMFTDLDASILVDYVKIFALSPEPPNAARIRNWASALTLGLAATGAF